MVNVMSKLNKSVKKTPIYTAEGAKAPHVNSYQMLRRSVCSCMLWENEFYEDGITVADRIASLVKEVPAEKTAALAIEARSKFKLRHVPLLLVRELARMGYTKTADTLATVIQRPDELTEFLALYWKDGRSPLSAQVKKGLAGAFTKFNAYQLAKYNRDEAIKLRDVLFLSHAKPVDELQAETWKKLVDGTLEPPDTWEVALSAGKNKQEAWTRLLAERKLGALALLRNLRNMQNEKVSTLAIKEGILQMKTERVLPFRFVAAAKYAPTLEPELEMAMLKCTESMEKLHGNTALLVDHSGSMQQHISAKSEMTRFDAAGALGIIIREICDGEFRLFGFSSDCMELAPRRGFAMLDIVKHGMKPQWTLLGKAVDYVYSKFPECERLIVITDEQSADKPKDPRGMGYIINVASYQNGIGYGAWKHIDGFSEAVIDWIREYEKL